MRQTTTGNGVKLDSFGHIDLVVKDCEAAVGRQKGQTSPATEIEALGGWSFREAEMTCWAISKRTGTEFMSRGV